MAVIGEFTTNGNRLHRLDPHPRPQRQTERAIAEAELAALVAQAQAEDEQFARDIELYLADLE